MKKRENILKSIIYEGERSIYKKRQIGKNERDGKGLKKKRRIKLKTKRTKTKIEKSERKRKYRNKKEKKSTKEIHTTNMEMKNEMKIK